jgi:hypothetical protein
MVNKTSAIANNATQENVDKLWHDDPSNWKNIVEQNGSDGCLVTVRFKHENPFSTNGAVQFG